ncbi:MAG: glycosyltransferase [Candidatus Moranbacteria bacterium]|nr:glycosyltransferase [Candidatus Moranbacteria bacterium]
MRILEVNKFYYPRRGAERHFLDCINLLKQTGHSVAVFTMDDKRTVSRENEKYFVSSVGYNGSDSNFLSRLRGIGRLFWSFEARRKMRALIRDFRPELVHVHNAYHQLSLSFFPLVKEAGIPLIMTVHDYAMISPDKDAYYPAVGKQYFKFLWIKKYSLAKRMLLVMKKYWEDWYGFYAFVDCFIVPSRFVENILLSTGIKKEKMIVLPHFIKNEKRESVSSEAPTDAPYALYFGAITEEKNIRELTAIFEELRFPLYLAGVKGMDIAEGKYVKYVGEKDTEVLRVLIGQALFVVSATRLPETFGLVALEANSLGKPFFGYATGAFPEIIDNGKNGWLVGSRGELKEKIVDFISGVIHSDSPDKISGNAKEKYGAENYMKKFEQLVGLVKMSGRE